MYPVSSQYLLPSVASQSAAVILSAGFLILRLTSFHENALSPLGERVVRDGAVISRRGPGEGVDFRGSEG